MASLANDYPDLLAALDLQLRVEQAEAELRETALSRPDPLALLEAGVVPEYEEVKARVVPREPLACPEVHVALPDLAAYDTLLEGGEVVA